MTSNAEKIAAWRDGNPDATITEKVLLDIIGEKSLRWADLGWADLRWADLGGANLREANLRGANLRGANLYGANLRGAASDGILAFQGIPSHDGYLAPTPDGWRITIGCWQQQTLDDLRALIATDDGWPEARGDEVTRRRPILAALLALCEAQIAAHPNAVPSLAKRWEEA